MMDLYTTKNLKRLRYGFTTGSCAAAASKAAAIMLFGGEAVSEVELMTPKQILLTLPVRQPVIGDGWAGCAIQKDSGDDPDTTDGMLIFARVSKIREKGILIEGGRGVGRITRPGLEQPVGSAAINRVPREMITEALCEISSRFGYHGGLLAEISIPGGEEAALKTFNPRLGIEGGLSILGTSGIVEPMSESALRESIYLEMRMKKAMGITRLYITPGNYGEAFLLEHFGPEAADSVKCSNFIGEAFDYAAGLGFKELVLTGHIGKLIKVSGGIMNTHSRNADSRLELLAAAALRAGADRETAVWLLECMTTDEALAILKQAGLLSGTMDRVVEKIQFYLEKRIEEKIPVNVCVFSNEYGLLGKTGGI